MLRACIVSESSLNKISKKKQLQKKVESSFLRKCYYCRCSTLQKIPRCHRCQKRYQRTLALVFHFTTRQFIKTFPIQEKFNSILIALNNETNINKQERTNIKMCIKILSMTSYPLDQIHFILTKTNQQFSIRSIEVQKIIQSVNFFPEISPDFDEQPKIYVVGINGDTIDVVLLEGCLCEGMELQLGPIYTSRNTAGGYAYKTDKVRILSIVHEKEKLFFVEPGGIYSIRLSQFDESKKLCLLQGNQLTIFGKLSASIVSFSYITYQMLNSGMVEESQKQVDPPQDQQTLRVQLLSGLKVRGSVSVIGKNIIQIVFDFPVAILSQQKCILSRFVNRQYEIIAYGRLKKSANK